MSLAELLQGELAGIIDLAPEQLRALSDHYNLLVRWNRKLNLTTVTGLPEAATRHYCESLFLASKLSSGKIVDVGSGAGFPGIPIGIGRPDCLVDLVESHQRKAVFLREASRGLPNIGVISDRAENLILQGCRYDWMVSRAVDPLSLVGLPLAPRYALLVGLEDAQWIPGAKFPVPWGERRILVIGESSTWNTP